MFFKVILTKELLVSPKDLGKKMKATVELRLKQAVEGKLLGDNGYCLMVIQISDSWMGSGIIDNTTGSVIFIVEYQALIYRPFKEEVIDAVVNAVNALGFFCSVGNFDIFVHRAHMPTDVQEFNNVKSAWISSDGQVEIKVNEGY